MKTCRFCLNQQESGDRCDACGSPFSADKLDFSEGLPETSGGFPDPTVSPVPAAPAVPAVEPAPEKKDGPAPAAVEAQSAAAVENPAAEVPAEEAPEEPKKIMYSAAIAGETVYLKSKGGNKNITSGAAPAQPAPAPQIQSYTPPAAPVYASANQSADTSRYSLISTHSLVTFILSCVGLLCCCGMSTPSLVMSLIAFISMQSVKAGKSGADAERLAKRANVLTIISDGWLIIAGFIIFLIIII